MKAQGGMLEDILMAVFILLIIVIAVFFVFSFEFGGAKSQQSGDKLRDTIFTADFLMQSPLIAKEDRVLDDLKISNFVSDKGCEDIKKILDKKKICIQIEKILVTGEKDLQCIEGRFDKKCTKWEICETDCLELEKDSRLVETPVNIHRTIQNKNELGLMRIKLPLD